MSETTSFLCVCLFFFQQMLPFQKHETTYRWQSSSCFLLCVWEDKRVHCILHVVTEQTATYQEGLAHPPPVEKHHERWTFKSYPLFEWVRPNVTLLNMEDGGLKCFDRQTDEIWFYQTLQLCIVEISFNPVTNVCHFKNIRSIKTESISDS